LPSYATIGRIAGAGTSAFKSATEHREEWCPGTESNRRHCDFQSHALPTELPGQVRGPARMAGSAVGASAYGQGARPWQEGSVALGDVFRVSGRARHSVAVVEPLREVPITAAARTERCEFLAARLPADRAGAVCHRETSWACGASSARAGLLSQR